MPSEKLFVLMGPTRAGKSTFINTIMGKTVAEEGAVRSYFSCTRDIKNYFKQAMDLDHLKRVFQTDDEN